MVEAVCADIAVPLFGDWDSHESESYVTKRFSPINCDAALRRELLDCPTAIE